HLRLARAEGAQVGTAEDEDGTAGRCHGATVGPRHEPRAAGWGRLRRVKWTRALGVPLAGLAGLAVHDPGQRQHAILRNFPVIGHGRSLIEKIGPELRQYVVAATTRSGRSRGTSAAGSTPPPSTRTRTSASAPTTTSSSARAPRSSSTRRSPRCR